MSFIFPLVDCTGIEPAGPALFLNCIHSVDAARLDIGARFMNTNQPIGYAILSITHVTKFRLILFIRFQIIPRVGVILWISRR